MLLVFLKEYRFHSPTPQVFPSPPQEEPSANLSLLLQSRKIGDAGNSREHRASYRRVLNWHSPWGRGLLISGKVQAPKPPPKMKPMLCPKALGHLFYEET
ncbi:UNVERIFIED_CONTAM: hypothetical protein K2H54_060228 [Gekko kuhli]